MYENNHTIHTWYGPKISVIREKKLYRTLLYHWCKISFKKINYSSEFWNTHSLGEKRTLTVYFVVRTSSMLRTYVIQIPSIYLAEFWHLNAWENGRYRMAGKIHFWWLKKYTYLVTVNFPVETLGIGDIQLKKQKQKT